MGRLLGVGLASSQGRDRKPAGQQVRPVFEAAPQRELSIFLLRSLRRAALEGARPAPEIKALASALSWAIFGAAVEWSRGSRALFQRVAVERVITTLIDGVARAARVAITR